jgi:uncharacterized protein YacL (UPF0231 family)
MKEKTVVEWLADKLKSGLGITSEIVELAKEMEKEQKKELVIGTYIDLKMKDCQLPYGMEYHNKLLETEEEAEQYYNGTYKQQEQ